MRKSITWPDLQSAADVAHETAVFKAFSQLATNNKLSHLHQQAGWVDIEDISVWDEYVADVMSGTLRDGDRLFEVGCGILAFLKCAKKLAKHVTIGGMDGAEDALKIARENAPPSAAENFFVGTLPDGMSHCEDNSWDIVVCNSVFQYFTDHDRAKQVVDEMLRASNRWVIIGDVIDAKYTEVEQKYAEQLGGKSAIDVPKYLTYPRSWWEQFETETQLLSVHKVRSKTYLRRRHRYTVYLEKDVAAL